MKGFKRRGIGLTTGFLALALAAPVAAQENLDSGKTGAQLYAADCAICHKSAQALKKSGGIFGLSSFLREHYTASRESAAAIASYLDSVGSPPAQKKPAGAAKRTAKGDEKKAKPKSGDAKSEKPDKKDKPGEAKTSEPKSESKGEPKSESKDEPKGEAKPSEAKSGEAKPAEAKTKDSKPAAAPAAKPAKPDKPEKSD